MVISKDTTNLPTVFTPEDFVPSSQDPMIAEELIRLGDIFDKGGPEALEREFRRLHPSPNPESPVSIPSPESSSLPQTTKES